MITIKNLIDIDPISTQFWCESYLWPYIDNVLCVQCFRLFLKYNLFQGNFHQRTTLYFVLVIIFIQLYIFLQLSLPLFSIEETSFVCIFSFVVLFSFFVFCVLFYYFFFAFCFILFVFLLSNIFSWYIEIDCLITCTIYLICQLVSLLTYLSILVVLMIHINQFCVIISSAGIIRFILWLVSLIRQCFCFF